jgi:hypothetical protein
MRPPETGGEQGPPHTLAGAGEEHCRSGVMEFRDKPSRALAAVLSTSGTSVKSSTNILGRSPMRSRTALTDAVAPKKNAPRMR